MSGYLLNIPGSAHGLPLLANCAKLCVNIKRTERDRISESS
jgi:hypothetical protein